MTRRPRGGVTVRPPSPRRGSDPAPAGIRPARRRPEVGRQRRTVGADLRRPATRPGSGARGDRLSRTFHGGYRSYDRRPPRHGPDRRLPAAARRRPRGDRHAGAPARPRQAHAQHRPHGSLRGRRPSEATAAQQDAQVRRDRQVAARGRRDRHHLRQGRRSRGAGRRRHLRHPRRQRGRRPDQDRSPGGAGAPLRRDRRRRRPRQRGRALGGRRGGRGHRALLRRGRRRHGALRRARRGGRTRAGPPGRRLSGSRLRRPPDLRGASAEPGAARREDRPRPSTTWARPWPPETRSRRPASRSAR